MRPAKDKTQPTFSFPKDRIRVLLLENIHATAVEAFEKEGYKVELLDRALSEDELIERIKNVSILGLRSNTALTNKVISNAKHLLVVGAFCIGTNQIDLEAAANNGTAVFNAPYSNSRSVVELAIAEIISLNRRLTDKNTEMHRGEWNKSAAGNHEIRGLKLGIVGYGNIGSMLSVLAESMGMQVYYYDIADKLSLGNAKQCETLKDLLKISDVVTLHVDGRPENKGIFGANEFAKMKQGALFLNLSRGAVVDTKALKRNLESGHLAGAALDVFPKEPKSKGELFVSELQGLPNVILTPHVASGTQEAQASIGQFVSKKIISFINQGSTTLSVNLPGLALPLQEDAHRLILIHKNVPGVLAKVNAMMAEKHINIIGQHLGTKGDIGYVVTDIAADYPDDTVKQLREMPETIKLRVLY